MAERQVEFYGQSPVASTESSTTGFLPDSVNRTNETGGRYVLKDAVKYEAMAVVTRGSRIAVVEDPESRSSQARYSRVK